MLFGLQARRAFRLQHYARVCNLLDLLAAGIYESDELGTRVSVFPDGTVMAVVHDAEPTVGAGIPKSAGLPLISESEQSSAWMTEAETRRQLIDRRLELAGWHVGNLSEVVTELEVPSAGGGSSRKASGSTGFADYGLVLQGKIAAVIEAKRASRDARLGREQALQYAQAIKARQGGLLDQFKTQDMPRVAISVDMLDTGLDIHEIVNLVFAKPVYSFTKFWQMIGRGTRLLHRIPEKRRAWCPEKEKFLIIDCWGNFEYWKMRPRGREPSGQVAPFTQIHPDGIRGVFQPEQIDEILEFAHSLVA